MPVITPPVPPSIVHLTRYCSYGPNFTALTDDMIAGAPPFPGHAPSYHDWGITNGIADNDTARNAYHVRYLAGVMLDRGGWIGGPLVVFPCGCHVQDGNHRMRARDYVRATYGVAVAVDRVVVADRACWRAECRANGGGA